MSHERGAGLPASDIPGDGGADDKHGIAGAGRHAEGGPVITEGDGFSVTKHPTFDRHAALRVPSVASRDFDAEWHAFADPIGICAEHPQPHCATCSCTTTAAAEPDPSPDPDAHGAT